MESSSDSSNTRARSGNSGTSSRPDQRPRQRSEGDYYSSSTDEDSNTENNRRIDDFDIAPLCVSFGVTNCWTRRDSSNTRARSGNGGTPLRPD